jgi:hypothetical protein
MSWRDGKCLPRWTETRGGGEDLQHDSRHRRKIPNPLEFSPTTIYKRGQHINIAFYLWIIYILCILFIVYILYIRMQ